MLCLSIPRMISLRTLLYDDAEYYCYYFGDSEDGAMKTGRTTIEIDGDSFTFNFETSGSKKGQGTTGVDDERSISPVCF